MTLAQLLTRYEQLKLDKSSWHAVYDTIAQLMAPRYAHSFFENRNDKLFVSGTNRMFSSKPAQAIEKFTSILDSTLTPANKTWHQLTLTDESLLQDQDVKIWLEQANRTLMKERYKPNGNFQANNIERWYLTAAFGTSVLYIDFNQGLRYKVIDLKHVHMDVNHQGAVDTMFRRIMLTANQAVMQFGLSKVPKEMVQSIGKKIDDQELHEFVHIVYPNPDVDNNKIDFRSKPFIGEYIAVATMKRVAETRGFKTFPYSVSRHAVTTNEIMGRSIAMTVLPDVKMLMEAKKTTITAMQKQINPPLAIHSDGVLGGGQKVNLTPGAINVGAVTKDGKVLVQPILTAARADIGVASVKDITEDIESAYMLDLFRVLVDAPRMSASEAMIRDQEKGALLTPTIGRQQAETLGPQIEREINLLIDNGVLPDIPELLLDQNIEITYTSPLNKLQQSHEVVGLQRTLEIITPIAQIDPGILDIINIDGIGELLPELTGIPWAMVNSASEVKRIREERNAQIDDAKGNDAMQQQADTAKTLSEIDKNLNTGALRK